MSTPLWRYFLSLCALFALFIAIGDAFDANRFGNIGVLYRPLSEREGIVTAVSPGSQAAEAGVRVGDRISAEWLRRGYVLGVNRFGSFRAGDRTSFDDAGLQRTVTVTATRIPLIFTPARVTLHILRILGLLIGLLLCWMLPADRAARVLAAFFLLVNITQFGNTGSFAFGRTFSDYLTEISTQTMLLTLVVFACWFPDRYPRDLRTRIASIATVYTTLMLACGVLAVSYVHFGYVPHIPGEAFQWMSNYFSPSLLGVLIIAALAIDFRTATQLNRLRLEWLAVGMAVEIYSFLAVTTFPSIFQTFGNSFNVAGLILQNVGMLLGTLCIAYAFLRYRVLDIMFAINRAVAFAFISSVVVALFIVVEDVLRRYVEAQSRVTSAAITVALALIIGFSLRAVHGYVDRLTDRVIFRARHRGVEALRKFARRAAFFNSEKDLLDETVRALIVHAGAQSAALYFADDAGNYASGQHCTSQHDPVVVALKDTRGPLVVEEASSTISAELVLPMLVRGELLGFAACAKRQTRETYTPIEIEAMNYALEHVAVQVDAIRTTRLQSQFKEVQDLVKAYRLGADPLRVLGRIEEVSGLTERRPGLHDDAGAAAILRAGIKT